jgi:hypothetical protein
MAAHQRLERVKIARLRRRDKEPITGPDYHRVTAVTRNTATGRAERTGSRCLATCDQAGRARAAPLPAASTKRPLSGVLLPVQAFALARLEVRSPIAARAPDSAIRRSHTPVCAPIDSRPPALHLRLTAASATSAFAACVATSPRPEPPLPGLRFPKWLPKRGCQLGDSQASTAQRSTRGVGGSGVVQHVVFARLKAGAASRRQRISTGMPGQHGEEWNAHERSHTATGRWVKHTR